MPQVDCDLSLIFLETPGGIYSIPLLFLYSCYRLLMNVTVLSTPLVVRVSLFFFNGTGSYDISNILIKMDTFMSK
jgi:hypothetical protein